MTSPSQVEPPPSRLLQLPAELRDMIWKLCAKAQSSRYSMKTGGFDPTTSSSLLHPLRATCRTINIEISPHVFNHTLFIASNRGIWHRRFFIWLERIGTNNRLAIRRLCPICETEVDTYNHPSIEAQKCARVLKELPNLREISFPDLWGRDVDYWQKVISSHELSQDPFITESCCPELSTALQSCSEISSWTCSCGMVPLVIFAVATPSLQALQIDLSGNNDQNLTRIFNLCPSLRYLQLGCFPTFIQCDYSSDNYGSYEPPKALQPPFLDEIPLLDTEDYTP